MDAFPLNLKYTDGKMTTLEVTPEMSVEDVKTIICAETEVSIERIQLLYLGRILKDE